MSSDHFAYANNSNRFLAADALQDQPFALAGFLSQPAMATAAMPKRIQPSKKTGIAATSGLVSAT